MSNIDVAESMVSAQLVIKVVSLLEWTSAYNVCSCKLSTHVQDRNYMYSYNCKLSTAVTGKSQVWPTRLQVLAYFSMHFSRRDLIP